jgi:hypothetical protein
MQLVILLVVSLSSLAACALDRVAPPAHAEECIDYDTYLRWIGRAEEAGKVIPARVIVFSDGVAFVGRDDRAFEVVDFASPLQPTVVGHLELLSSPLDLVVDDDIVFACDGVPGLTVIDVANPAAPAFVSSLLIDAAQHIALGGDHVYVATPDSLHVVLVSDPTAPQVVARLAFRAVHDLCVAEQVLYATSPAGLHLFDVSVPATPVLADSLAIPEGVMQVEVSGRYAYLCAGTGEVLVVDLEAPGTAGGPAIVGRAPIAGNVADAVLDDGILHVSLFSMPFGLGGLELFDVSVPTSPASGGLIALEDYLTCVAVSPPHAFAGAWKTGIQVFELIKPLAPAAVGEVEMMMGCWNVATSTRGASSSAPGSERQLVFASHREELGYLLGVIDLTEPAVPSVVSDVLLSLAPADFATDGDLLYVAEHT